MENEKFAAQMRNAAARLTWQYRAIEYTRGNQTPTGCIVIAMLGKTSNNPPRLNNAATITHEGLILCDFQDKEGYLNPEFLVGPVTLVVRDFRRLADELKFTDEERMEMFAKLRAWISIDERANKDVNLFH